MRECESFLLCPVQSPVGLSHFGIPESLSKRPSPPETPAPLFWGVRGSAGAGQPPVRGADLAVPCTPACSALQCPHHADCEPLSSARPPERPPRVSGRIASPPPTRLGPQRDLLCAPLSQTLHAARPCSAWRGRGWEVGGIKLVCPALELCLRCQALRTFFQGPHPRAAPGLTGVSPSRSQRAQVPRAGSGPLEGAFRARRGDPRPRSQGSPLVELTFGWRWGVGALRADNRTDPGRVSR